jgi:O-antigen/teichoic acid export membrane protein
MRVPVFGRLVKDSAIYGGADLISKILSFFAFPIIAAALSPKAFGALELIFTATSLLALVMNCGLNNAVQRFYWDIDTVPTMRPAIVTSGMYALAAFGIVALMVGLAAIPHALPLMLVEEWPLTWVALVAALIVMVLSQWSQYVLDVIRLHLAPWRFLVLALTSRVASMSFGLAAVVWLGFGVDGFLAAQALVLVSVMPLALWMIRKDFRLASFDWTWLKKLVQFGHPFIYAGLAYWLFGSMDRWMLASMASIEEVGTYSVAFRFASAVLFVSVAFGQAWSPVAMKIRTDHPESYRAIFGQVLLLLLFVMLAVGGGIALFSGEVISLIMPMEYLPSALPLAILCFGITLQATQQVTAVGISIEKKTYLFARLAWLAVPVNLVGNWLLIPYFGAAGAAWATLISYCVLTGSYLYYTQRLHPLIVEWWRLLFFGGLGILLLCLSVIFTAKQLDWQLVIFKVAFLFVGLGIGWRLLPIRRIEMNK